MSKMASSNFLDDVLNTEADESAVSALVGSLESQLASSTSQAVLIDVNNSNGNANVNNSHTFHSAATAVAATTIATAALSANGIHATSAGTSTSTCNNITVPVPTASLQPHNAAVHSILPNGNASGMVFLQLASHIFSGLCLYEKLFKVDVIIFSLGLVVGNQFTAANTLPNGTMSSGTATTMALSGLVIPQGQQKPAGQVTQHQSTMIVPNKINPVGQQPSGTNGTMASQISRPAAQVQQQLQPIQQTMINSAPGMQLPAGVQVVNMNSVRAAQNVQNLSAVNTPANRALAPRVVLAPQQVVGVRPGQVGITLQALQVFLFLFSYCW